MTDGAGNIPEIESFNLADLDVAVLDVRLELTTMIPACTLIACEGNEGGGGGCGFLCNTACKGNGGCVSHH